MWWKAHRLRAGSVPACERANIELANRQRFCIRSQRTARLLWIRYAQLLVTALCRFRDPLESLCTRDVAAGERSEPQCAPESAQATVMTVKARTDR